MTTIILIEQNEEQRNVISTMMGTFLGLAVIHHEKPEETIELLSILPDLPLIICQPLAASSILSFIHAQNLPTKMIVTGKCPLDDPRLISLQEPINWEELVHISAKQLRVPLKENIGNEDADFVEMDLKYFSNFTHVPCDVFIRLGDSSGDYHYVCLFQALDVCDQEVLNKYQARKLRSLFIPADCIGRFTNYFTDRFAQMSDAAEHSLVDRTLFLARAHNLIRTMIQKLDAQGSWGELSSTCASSMAQVVRETPSKEAMIKFLLEEDLELAYRHSHLVTLLCHFIMQKQSSYQPEELQALSFAAFFTHMTLKHPSQMLVTSEEDFSLLGLNESEKREVLSRSWDVLHLLRFHPETEDLSLTILLQAAGAAQGVGFYPDPEETLHPLSKVFVVADAFVKVLLNEYKPSHKKEILELLHERFKKPGYRKIIKLLEQRLD